MDSHSLIARLSVLASNGTLSTRLTLASREHDSIRLPMLPRCERNLATQQLSRIRRTATARAASAVLQDLRLQMRVAEDLIAKLGYQMRELNKLRSPVKASRNALPAHVSILSHNPFPSPSAGPSACSSASSFASTTASSTASSFAGPSGVPSLSPGNEDLPAGSTLAKVLNFRTRAVSKSLS